MNPSKSYSDSKSKATCPFCQRQLSSTQGLLSHIHAVHKSANNANRFSCESCNYSTSSKNLLSYHVKRSHGTTSRSVVMVDPPMKMAKTVSAPSKLTVSTTATSSMAAANKNGAPTLEIAPQPDESIHGPEKRKSTKTPVLAPKKTATSVEFVVSDSSSNSSSSSSGSTGSNNSRASLKLQEVPSRAERTGGKSSFQVELNRVQETVIYVYAGAKVQKQARSIQEWYTLSDLPV